MMQMAIRENLTLSLLSDLTRFKYLSIRREVRKAAAIGSRFAVRAPSLEVEVQTLSGGNQQKVLVGKSLASNVKILLCADITRGVDVGTKAELYELVREVAAMGAAVIFYSSDSTELVALCHRVAVMYDRTISTILEGETLNEENLVRSSVGGTIARAEGSKDPSAGSG
jgi:ribose transport system ATP-binding protein